MPFINNYGKKNYQYPSNNPNDYKPRSNGRNSRWDNYEKPIIKHSGAKHHTSFVDKATGHIIDAEFITAWNASKSRGMLSIIATPRKDKEKRITKSPFFENWAVKVRFERDLSVKWFNGLFDVRTGKIIVQDMQFVINPKAKNGGYCGTYVQKKR